MDSFLVLERVRAHDDEASSCAKSETFGRFSSHMPTEYENLHHVTPPSHITDGVIHNLQLSFGLTVCQCGVHANGALQIDGNFSN